jgi:hypothetical protein
VKIRDYEYVEKLLLNMVNRGKEILQVVSDFDRTISLSSKDGTPCFTSNGNENQRCLFYFIFLFYWKLLHFRRFTEKCLCARGVQEKSNKTSKFECEFE